MNWLLSPDNHLIALARRGKRLTNVLLVLVLSIVIVVVGSFGVFFGYVFFGPSILEPGMSGSSALQTGLIQAAQLVFSFAPTFLLLWAWVALFEGRPLWTLGLEAGGALRKYLRGMAFGLAMFGGAVLLMSLLGYATIEEGGDPRLQGFGALGGILLVYLGWTVQGPAEEIIWRGWALQEVGAKYGTWIGILVSSAGFALAHSLNPNLSPISVLNLFLIGIFLALYALFEGSLWGVFAWHAVWNWAQGNVFGYQVSGLIFGGGALVDLQEAGPDAITGGPFGPEGGLAVTVVILASILVVLVLARRQAAPGRAV
jgi:membrane protease YdiL (CAAX protease family)